MKERDIKMKFIIWGAGERGKRISYHINKENVVAFIDTNEKRVGELYEGSKVIDFKEYLEKYQDICIVISTHEEEVVDLLHKNGIFHYFRMSECPEDFQSSNMRMILKTELQKSIDLSKQYAVFGNTLYSILLYCWLRELDLKYTPFLVMGEDCNDKILCKLKNEWGKFVLNRIEEILDKPEVVLATVEKDSTSIEEIPAEMQKNIIYVLRYSEHISAYYNQQIEKFRNVHHGKRCFIIGLGPSLRSKDLDILHRKHEVCISMNAILKIFDKTPWRPDYYVVSDYRLMLPERFESEQLKEIQCFMSDSYAPFCEQEHEDNIFIYHLGRLWKNEGYIPFSENFAQIAYNNATVTYVAIELAVYMGFDEIYLLGVDASGINGNYEKYTHFFKEEKLVSTCFSNQVYVSYMSAKKYADEHGIKIYNATRGGELEVFERVNFDLLF